MINLKKHLDMLGLRVEDRVSGFKGVITSISFDLYGCIQAVVHPGLDKDGKQRDSHWFDVNRLTVTQIDPVMPRPQFDWSPEDVSLGKQGAAEKPASTRF